MGKRKTRWLRTARRLLPPGQGGTSSPCSPTLRVPNSLTGPPRPWGTRPPDPSNHSSTPEVLLQLQKPRKVGAAPLAASHPSTVQAALLMLPAPEEAEAGKAHAASRSGTPRSGQQQEAGEL